MLLSLSNRNKIHSGYVFFNFFSLFFVENILCHHNIWSVVAIADIVFFLFFCSTISLQCLFHIDSVSHSHTVLYLRLQSVSLLLLVYIWLAVYVYIRVEYWKQHGMVYKTYSQHHQYDSSHKQNTVAFYFCCRFKRYAIFITVKSVTILMLTVIGKVFKYKFFFSVVTVLKWKLNYWVQILAYEEKSVK